MKLLFVHDVKADIYENDVFARSYGYDIWNERYLPNFSQIKVCFRTKKTNTDLNGISDKEAKTKAMELMKRVGLEDQLAKKTGKYSRGMRQRLGLADVLIKNPEIIILDDATI